MFNSSQAIKRLPLLLFYFTLIACNLNTSTEVSRQSPAQFSVSNVDVDRFITSQNLTRLKLKNARCIQEQIGDGNLGPSDFRTFCVLTVASKDIAALRETLSPLNLPDDAAQYGEPRKAVPWWLSEAEFKTLELFKPGLLAYRANGWTGVSSKTGKIYLFGFTQ
jgi:hypothetical protein